MNTSQIKDDHHAMGISGGRGEPPLIGLYDDDGRGDGRSEPPLVGFSSSYDFHAMRNEIGNSLPQRNQSFDNIGSASTGGWNSTDTKNYDILDSSRINHSERMRDSLEMGAATSADVDRIIKSYFGSILSVLKKMDSRFSDFEDRTCYLETSVNELKKSFANNAGATDGKLRQLENILREVQNDVRDMRDKQEISDSQLQLQLVKLQTSNADRQASNSTHSEPQVQTQPQPHVVPQQQTQHPSYSGASLPNLSAPPPLPQQQPSVQIQQQSLPPPVLPQQQTQHPSSYSATPIPSSSTLLPPQPPQHQPLSQQNQMQENAHYQFQSPIQPPEQQYPPPSQVLHFRPPAPSMQAQPPYPHHSEETPPYVPQNPSYTPNQIPRSGPPAPSMQTQPPYPHHSEETPPYIPQNPSYTPNKISRGGPPAQFYTPKPDMYEQPPQNRPHFGQFSYPSGPGFPEPYGQGGYDSPPRPSIQPFSSSGPPLPAGNIFPRPPMADFLPRQRSNRSSPDTHTGGALPVEEIVDRVSSMGFSKDQVRATMLRMADNGQSPDLNAVLDKLTNGGDIIQPQGIWREQ